MIAVNQPESFDAQKVLGPEGLIAKSSVDFEPRQEQLEMSQAVWDCMNSGRHLAVEAGTGTGKSFAYLIPAILKAQENVGRVVISTYTINLQEQLINKDIPFLAQALDVPFTACLAKGRSNYLCLRRLEYARKKQQGLFDNAMSQMIDLNDWANSTEDGSLSDLDFVPDGNVWDAVKSEHGNCRGRKCPFFNKCFYWRARRRLDNADIVVVNHALLFSDLALKTKGLGVLPDYTYVVLDEAHNIEHVAEDHFGINITNYSLLFLLNSLYNTRNRKGVLSLNENAAEARELVIQCYEAMRLFFMQIDSWYENGGKRNGGKCYSNFVDDNITEIIRKLRLEINKLVKNTDDEDDQFELTRHVERLRTIEMDLKLFLTQPNQENEHVFWVEISNGRHQRIQLRSAPIDVGPYVKEALFDQYASVILTSATLSVGGSDKKGFEFFSESVGLEDFESMLLGSPFDYFKQVSMYIETQMPEPNSDWFMPSAVEAIKRYVTQTSGKAFVLFTSYSMLRSAANLLEDWFQEQGINLLLQGGGSNRSEILKSFREDTDSVLFGTDSFWQGVDVPGESLSNVIIVKLPFAVPSHPLIQGRIEKLKSQGHAPFFKFQLPSAIIKFKQGFGRLIRKKTDRGIVVVLDSRVVTKRYGQEFINAVPRCNMVYV